MDDKIRLDKPHWWVGISLGGALIIYGLSFGWLDFESGPLDVRWQILLITGIATWILMTLSVAIALRWRWMGRLVGGLDKGYEIHKWSGIFAMSIIFIHWAAVQSWRWMTEWGWLDSYGPAGLLGNILGNLGMGGNFPLDPISRIGGGVAFFLMLAIVVVALLRKVPYHAFWSIHKLTPVVYLFGSVHVLNRMPNEWWLAPAAYLVLALTVVGIYGSVISLKQAIGKDLRTRATIESVSEENDDLLDIELRTEQPLIHNAGQFAFVNFVGLGHESHPFSFASHDERQVRFIIKEEGDTTGILKYLLEPGQTLNLEGPYGDFDLESQKPYQIWIAGGIGVTPFIARLEELSAGTSTEQEVHFWYSVSTEEEGRFPSDLDELCEKADVVLHRVVSGRDNRLSAEHIMEEVGDLRECSAWFCGPDGFGSSIKEDLVSKGLLSRNFHSEIFDLR